MAKKRTGEEWKAARGLTEDPTIEKTPIIDSVPEPSTEPTEAVNPLMTPVVDREYTKPNYRVIGGQIPNSVEQPVMERPIIDLREPVENTEGPEQPKQKEEPRFGSFENPSYSEMKPKAQKESAKNMANTFVDGYVQLNNLCRDHLVKTDTNKLQLKAIKGEFDMDALNVQLPISESETISVAEVIETTNSGADEVFVVSDDFQDEARELLTEICKEKGIGMTPTQRLIYLVLQDAVPKGIAAFGLMKTNKEILNAAMAILAQAKSPSQPINTNIPEPVHTQQSNPVSGEPEPSMQGAAESEEAILKRRRGAPTKAEREAAAIAEIKEKEEIGNVKD